MIEVLSNGALNLVQDLGRAGHLDAGVSESGAMDAPALRIANLLVGNNEGAAGIEICIFPFRIRFERRAWFACAGATTSLTLSQKDRPGWTAVEAQEGDVLSIAPPQRGSRVVLAIQGGIDVPPVLGSRSTDLKSGFGGMEGRGLRKGDRLSVGAHEGRTVRPIAVAPASRIGFMNELDAGTIRVRAVAAAEYPHFTDEAQAAFGQTSYRLTPDCNRQGYRLEGAAMPMRRKLELLSHGVLPGTIQVPPSGQPIVQMAEANTLGGYPKIATVIETDLWRLAQMRPGQAVRFELIDMEAAQEAIRTDILENAGIRQELALMTAASAR
nr:biotin-dependent carboxyltransferase family protein [uncultured Shinella sp.]